VVITAAPGTTGGVLESTCHTEVATPANIWTGTLEGGRIADVASGDKTA
jgi:hypothetical protein